MNSIPQLPLPRNEPVLGYAPGSPERTELKAALKVMAGEQIEIPLLIGGREVRTGNTATAVIPHDHGHVLGDVSPGRRGRGAPGREGRARGAARVGALAVGRAVWPSSSARRTCWPPAGGR